MFRSILSQIGSFFFRYRNGLFAVTFVVLAATVRPAFFLGHQTLDLFTTGIGILCALGGGLLRILTIGLVYIRRGGRNRKVFAEDLVIDGIYAHVRNPMYLGNLLIVAGVCLIYGSHWLLAALLPLCLLIYVSIVAEEERFLTTKFGERFDAYCRSVPRFWPNLVGVLGTIGSYSFNWTRVVKKEYGTTCVLVGAVYALALWKYWFFHGLATDPTLKPIMAAPLLVLLGAYAMARFLKKSRRI